MNAKHAPGCPLLQLDRVSLAIHDTPILHEISLSVDTGQTLGIIGESGSGKSMTALSIMQLLPRGAHLSGGIRFAGQQLQQLSEQRLCDLRGSDIGMIFQEPMTALNPVKSIGDQVSESIRLHRRVTRDESLEMTAHTLERVGLPNPAFPLDRYPHELSGGQRQRVVIAIAIACQPALLIADEPTTALDVTTQAGILELLRSLQQEEGLALILITHDLAVVSNMADDIVVMRNGRVVESGVMSRVFSQPAHPYTRTLFEASALTQVPRHDDARARRAHRGRGGRATPLLRVENLVCEYPGSRRGLFRHGPGFRAVDDVTFSIAHGESVALVGESGCGKSTLTRALLGLMKLHAGRIELDGESVSAAREVSRQARRQMQVVFQDPYGSFNPRHRVLRLVSEPLHVLPHRPSRTDRRARVSSVLESVGLQATDADKYIHEFSGGQRQRIAIARALIIEPSLIILDEAVSALDVSVRAQVLQLLDDLARGQGLAYLFISHDLSVVQRISDQVLVMRHGRIVEQGSTRSVFDNPAHEYTRQLLAAAPRLNDFGESTA
ncbi:MAG: ABC transporter ATP-binding protein [Granulosicoccus sp.]|nr:ABC transporter ATP-binding protein [Granulosicoccus sp.]